MPFLIDSHLLADICRENDIIQLRVFGSHVRGDARADSDVDLIATFSRKKSLVDVIQIEEKLSERLKKKVDLVTEAALSPYLRQRILNAAEVVYDRAG